MKKKNTASRLNKVDYFIFIFCAIGAVTMFALFYRDMNSFTLKKDEEPIARIYFKKNTAQRKFADNDVWEILRSSSYIYDGDKIRTSQNSEAYTEFSDSEAQLIQLREKSMIQIFRNRNEKVVDFVSGEIHVTNVSGGGEKLIVRANQKEIELGDSSEVEITIPEKSGSSQQDVVIEVVKGRVEVSQLKPDGKKDASVKSTVLAGGESYRNNMKVAAADVRRESAVETVVEHAEPVIEHVEPVIEHVEPVIEHVEPIIEQVEPAFENSSSWPNVETVKPVIERTETVTERKKPVETKKTDVKPKPVKKADSGRTNAVSDTGNASGKTSVEPKASGTVEKAKKDFPDTFTEIVDYVLSGKSGEEGYNARVEQIREENEKYGVFGIGAEKDDSSKLDSAKKDAAKVEIVENEAAAKDPGKVLTIYAENDEFKTRVADYYPGYDAEKNRIGNVKVNWIIPPSGNSGSYLKVIENALATQDVTAQDDRIDMFLVESAYIQEFIESSGTLDMISDVGISSDSLSAQYQYVKDVTGQGGKLKGLSWQACPGGLIYRRSIARDVLGTDDPEKVQEMLSDWDRFDEVAAKAKEKGYYMVSGPGDDFYAVSRSGKSTWIQDGTLTVPDDMKRWVSQQKEFSEKEYSMGAQPWSKEQMQGLKKDGRVFCYFGPSWYYSFNLAPEAGDSAEGSFGDWAICTGPSGFYWGGTWVFVRDGSDNLNLSRDILEKLTSDDSVMLRMARGTGDFVNNERVMESLASDASFGVDFLGGQNPVPYLLASAKSIGNVGLSGYDNVISDIFMESMMRYFRGEVPEKTAYADFYEKVHARYPDLIVPEIELDVLEVGAKGSADFSSARFARNVFNPEEGRYNYEFTIGLKDIFGADKTIPKGSIIDLEISGVPENDIPRLAVQVSTGEREWKRAHVFIKAGLADGGGPFAGKRFVKNRRIILSEGVANTNFSSLGLSYEPDIHDAETAIKNLKVKASVVGLESSVEKQTVGEDFSREMNFASVRMWPGTVDEQNSRYEYNAYIDTEYAFGKSFIIPSRRKYRITISGTCSSDFTGVSLGIDGNDLSDSWVQYAPYVAFPEASGIAGEPFAFSVVCEFEREMLSDLADIHLIFEGKDKKEMINVNSLKVLIEALP